MTGPDFDGRPFVAGTITGVRHFAVTLDGTLTGVSVEAPFRPGDNTADCTPYGGLGSFLSRSVVQRQMELIEERLRIKSSRPTHRVGQVGCSCGFWAYFQRVHSPYALRPDTVCGLIEGWGTVTVGERGFRASNARLVALVLPEQPAVGHLHRGYDRTADWCYRHDSVTPALAACCFVTSLSGGLPSILGAAAAGYAWLAALAGVVSVLLFAIGVTLYRAAMHGIDRAYLSTCSMSASPTPRTIRRRYPDVPTYPTLDAALDKHPLTNVENGRPS